jgi:hypothetical protein
MLQQRHTMRWSFLGAVVCATLLTMTGCYYGYMGASADFAYSYPYPNYYAGIPYGYYGWGYPYPSFYASWYYPYGVGWWGYYGYPYYGYPYYGYPYYGYRAYYGYPKSGYRSYYSYPHYGYRSYSDGGGGRSYRSR